MSNKLIKENKKKKKEKRQIKINWGKVINALVMLLVPVIVFYLQEFMIRNPFEKMKVSVQILNIFFWEFLLIALFCVSGRLKIAIWLECLVAFLLGLSNYYVISFRGAPIQPWDFASIGVAASVASGYDYSIKKNVWICIIGLILICAIAYFCNMRMPRILKRSFRLWTPATWKITGRRSATIRGAAIVLSVAALIIYGFNVGSDATVKRFKIYDKLFTPLTMTYKDGTPVAFLIEAKYMRVEKPEGYSKKNAEDLLSQYADATDSEGESVKPNIIVIMNEAFSDLKILDDYSTNIDEMPFVRSLLRGTDNSVSGYLDVSVVGGNTANTEFEFLTGDSMAWLPQGSVPYQQYVNRPTESMASTLKQNGYSTVAIHPYKPKGWCRDTVYDYFGFDRFYSVGDFENPQTLRKYVSDKADYEKIIELYENRNESEPLFIFNVTMQNHSPYTEEFEDFDPEVQVEGIKSQATNQYLSLMHRSDEALEELISYFDNQTEPVILVFFGDHQPTDSVVSPIYKLNGRNVYSLSDEEETYRYKVPFVVWSNTELAMSDTDVSMSPNLLGAKVLQMAGVSMTPYERFMCELGDRYDSISLMQVRDSDGSVSVPSESREELSDYRILQYYHLFNK